LTFCALRQPIRIRAAEQLPVATSYDGKQVATWPTDQTPPGEMRLQPNGGNGGE